MKLHMVLGSTLFWLNCNALRERCEKNYISLTAFYLFPAAVTCLPVFAQWHFQWAVGLLVFCLAITILLRFLPTKTAVRSRCFVTGCTAIPLLPAVITVFCYDLRGPTYEASQELWASLTETEAPSLAEEPADPFLDKQLLLQQFHPQRWKTFSLQEKADLFQHLVAFECSLRFGIPTVPITIETLAPEIRGQYRPEDDTMICNLSFLDTAPVEDVLFTAAHECHHAYTHYLISYTDWHDPVSATRLFEPVRVWQANYETYIHHSNYEAYLAQPVEVDANAWAEQEVSLIQAYIGS